MFKPRRVEPTIVYTPLPSRAGKTGEKGVPDEQPGTSSVAGSASEQASHSDPFLRAENEDDDGYDPYSDRHEESAFFEPNPWD